MPHLFLAIDRLQLMYSRKWLVTISECTLLDFSITRLARLACSFVDSFKSLIYLILCLYLVFCLNGGGKTGSIIILESTSLSSLIGYHRLT